MTKRLNVVILAAGKGERMLSKKPKVMHEIMGKPMIAYVVERAKELKPESITVVTGFGREKIESFLKKYKVNISVQTEQKGTAHAVLTVGKFIKGGDTLILYGDVPLIENATLDKFISFFRESGNITFMTTNVENPTGYGRVILDGNTIIDIIEDADATVDEKTIKEINTGICIIPENNLAFLKQIKNNNKKGEFYLTDICKVSKSKGLPVMAFHYNISSEVLGVNGRKELLDANITMRDKILDSHMINGVTLLDRNIYIEGDVTIGNDSIISSNSHISGKSKIGNNVFIGPSTMIKDTILNNNVHIEGFSVIDNVEIAENKIIQAFTRITSKSLF